jgi:two-component system sensor histidine kinase MtrB
VRKAGGVSRTPTPRPADTRRRTRFGLRARVTAAFTLASLALSLALSITAYGITRNYLLNQRENAALNEAFGNASFVRDFLADPRTDVNLLVSQRVRTEAGGFAVLLHQHSEYLSNVGFDQQALPLSLREAVGSGRTARQRFARNDTPYLAVGVYIAEDDADYYEVFPLDGLERTLGVLTTSLALGTAVATLIAAGIGLWASRNLLRPLSRVASAASDLAEGGLDTRLSFADDPDLDRLVTSFNDMADAVQSRIEREARFASDVSHELRSPLTALTAAVQVLEARRADLPERSQQALDVVVNQVNRFDRMVLDLLEISRLDAGAAELHAEPVLLSDFVPRVAARYGFTDVPVCVGGPWADERVVVDKRRVERILANLLGNAEQHGGGPVKISVDGDDGHVRIAVEDAGPGVSAAEHERIFERFARGSAARHRMGTGLGLALVAEHAQLHGGRAWVEDRDGMGARFVVELPAVTE